MGKPIAETPLFEYNEFKGVKIRFCIKNNLPLIRYRKGEIYSDYRLDVATTRFGRITDKGKAEVEMLFKEIIKQMKEKGFEPTVYYEIGTDLGSCVYISHVLTSDIKKIHESMIEIISNEENFQYVK